TTSQTAARLLPMPLLRAGAAAGLLLTGLLLSGCGGPGSGDAAQGASLAAGSRFGRAGHERMLGTLRQVAEQGRIDNPFPGEKSVEKLRAAAAEIERVPPEKRPMVFGELGRNELRLGNTDAAVKAFESLDALTRDLPGRREPSPALFYLGLSWMRW